MCFSPLLSKLFNLWLVMVISSQDDAIIDADYIVPEIFGCLKQLVE